MAESKQAWDQVGRDFTELGQHLKRHYSQQDTQHKSQSEKHERDDVGAVDSLAQADRDCCTASAREQRPEQP